MKKPTGWKNESRRHSLARKGVKTVIDDKHRLAVNNYVARGSTKNTTFINNVYSVENHDQAKRDIIKHLNDNLVVTLFDGSGWEVTFFPPKGDMYVTSVGKSLDGGLRYLHDFDAGMIKSWEWRIHAYPYQAEEFYEPFGSKKRSNTRGK